MNHVHEIVSVDTWGLHVNLAACFHRLQENKPHGPCVMYRSRPDMLFCSFEEDRWLGPWERERENRERKTGDGAMALDSTPVANRGAGGSGNDRMHRYNHKEDMGGGVTSEDAQR